MGLIGAARQRTPVIPPLRSVPDRKKRDQSSMPAVLAGASFALGLAEVAIPGAVDLVAGVRPTPGTRTLTRACGTREIAEGIAILAAPDPSYGAWSRVAGDALDLSLLGLALATRGNRRSRVAATTAAIAAVTAGDVVAALRLRRAA